MATTSVPTVPAPQTQAAISPVGRIVGVFFSPKATFEDIVRKPSWVLPVLLLTIFSVAVKAISFTEARVKTKNRAAKNNTKVGQTS